jgi:cell division protein FtsN
MDDNSKLYVFARKEIALIFLFMILIASASFMLGIKLGKSHSYQAAGVTALDREKVELLSGEEEFVQQAVALQKERPVEQVEESKEQLKVDTYSQLEREFEQLDKEQSTDAVDSESTEESAKGVQTDSAEEDDVLSVAQNSADQLVNDAVPPGPESKIDTSVPVKEEGVDLKGKYTIQLGSYQNIKDAEQFADGFKVKGYNPIINEVEIKGRGRWFRVSLGAFDTGREAREYINKEQTLFRRKEAIISRF